VVDRGSHAVVLIEMERIVLILNGGAGRKTANDKPASVCHSDRDGDDLRVSVGEQQLAVCAIPVCACLYSPEMTDWHTWTVSGQRRGEKGGSDSNEKKVAHDGSPARAS